MSATTPTADGVVAPAASATSPTITVRALQWSDISAALSAGWADFRAAPTHLFVIALMYPIGALGALWVAADRALLPLAFPVISGLALLGPFAAVFLYELSRRREAGQAVKWWHGFNIFDASSTASLSALGVGVALFFVAWLAAAYAIYAATLGAASPDTIAGIAGGVFTTREGLRLLLIGNGVGLAFAVVAFSLNIVSFPLLVDRRAGPLTAMGTSLRVVAKSPVVSLAWGATIAVLLLLGLATLMVGLAVILPLLGHASWHIYRRAVAA